MTWVVLVVGAAAIAAVALGMPPFVVATALVGLRVLSLLMRARRYR